MSVLKFTNHKEVNVLDQFETDILVDLVVTRANVDKTVPDPNDLRKGWRTDALLVDIDALVAGQKNDPAAYAEIGRRVLEEVRDLPEMAALAKLAILRGERLRHLTPEQVQLVCELSEDLKTAISALSGGTRKKRCQELFLYHTGIFYDALGRFDLAAETQEWAAREAGGESSSAAISRYCAALSRLKHALLVGEPSDKLEALFLDLEVEKSGQLANALHYSELQVQWVEGNYPMHMILTCVWLNWPHSKWENWVVTAFAAAEKLGKAWKPGAEFVRAAYMEKRDDPQAVEVLEVIATSSGNPDEIRATALLLLARHALRDGDKDRARNFIGQMPVEGAQHVRAIAERMIA